MACCLSTGADAAAVLDAAAGLDVAAMPDTEAVFDAAAVPDADAVAAGREKNRRISSAEDK